MGNIVLLDDLTINKIAAGEVIERPASVIKEMVENSIDAGAKNITIEIKNGGISFIKITDDGSGIAEDDMEIAFERHATSKIRNAIDLTTVKSMGFRGEALASIAAIANVEMISKKSDDTVAHKIIVEGGKVLEKGEAARSTGTTITVQKLFFNTPVRYKFLKKDYTESGYIEDAVTRIALINTDVAIKLINSGKTIIQTNGNGDLKTAVYSIYGKDIATEVLNIDSNFEGIKVTGVVGKPVIARANRSNQLFFVNGRYIKDKNISAAIEQASKGTIPVGRCAFAILNLEMEPEFVDVNVHPAKLEVRFEDDSKVFKAVYNAVKEVFTKNNLTENNSSQIVENSAKIATDILGTIPSMNTESYSKSEINSEENKIAVSEESEKSEIEKIEEKEPVRRGFSGFFSKVLKSSDPEKEEEEEKNENLLEELYKNRTARKLGENTEINSETKKENESDNKPLKTSENQEKIENVNDEKTENTTIAEPTTKMEARVAEILENIKNKNNTNVPNTINNSNIDKKVQLENTLVSSDTAEVNVTGANLNEIVNETSKVAEENNNATQVINTAEILEKSTENTVQENTESNDETKTEEDAENIKNVEDINKESENKESKENIENTEIVKEQNTDEEVTSETEFLNSEKTLNDMPEVAEMIEKNKESHTAIVENKPSKLVLDNSAFESIATELVESKLDFDSTQTVDTNKVREALEKELPETNVEFNQMYKQTFGKDTFTVRKEKAIEDEENKKINASESLSYATAENMTVFEEKEEKPKMDYKILGVSFDTYVLVEIKNELYMIDQYKAHERILYEKLKQSYYDDEKSYKQELLLPDVISLQKKEMQIARENKEMFEKAGFSFEEFGENTIKLNSVPNMCEELNTKQLFLDVLNELDKVAITDVEEKADKFIGTVAYKTAIKGKAKLSQEEVVDLIEKLLSLKNPFSYVLGKPIALKMTKYDLERKFSRK